MDIRRGIMRIWLWSKKNWKHIMPIILTIVIVVQGYLAYQLNKKVTERDVEINKGKQVLLLYNTKEFLIRYITNFLKYLAYEHNKILTTHFNIIYSGKPADPALPLREGPTISRRYYVNTLLLKTFYECRPLIGFLPDEQNQIDAYFGANPALCDLEKGIFNSKQTAYYLDLKRLIDQFNQDFNKFATMNKQLEEQEIKILLKDKNRNTIDWTKLLIYEKNSLVQSIKTIKEKGDLLLKSFPELNVETLKFNIEINAPEPLRKYEGVNTKQKLEGYINPIKEATIFLDDKNYKFDYYIYFTKSIEDRFLADRKDMKEKEKSEKIKVTTPLYYKVIN